MKKFVFVFACLVVFFTGCQYVLDSYPSGSSKQANDYIADPCDGNTTAKPFPWPSIRSESQKKDMVILKHEIYQLDLKQQAEMDKVKYESALKQINLNIENAKIDREQTIGTLDKPGLGLALLFGATGLGAYFTGLRTQRSEDYSVAEVKELLLRQKNGENVSV